MTMTNQPAPQPNDDRSLVTRLDDWLDQRTGIDSILHETLDEPIPGGPNGPMSSDPDCSSSLCLKSSPEFAWPCITCHQQTTRTQLFPTS